MEIVKATIDEYLLAAQRAVNATTPTPGPSHRRKKIYCDPSFPFVMKITTTSAWESFTIPCTPGTFNFCLSWGEGPSVNVTSYDSPSLTHTYDVAGTYKITIYGVFPNIRFVNKPSSKLLKSVESLGKVGWTNFTQAFLGCSNMTTFNAGPTNTSLVTTGNSMLSGCSSLTSVDLTQLTTSSMTSLKGFFNGCSSLTSVDLSSFDTSKVTNFSAMFNGCSSLTSVDLSGFTTSKGTNFNSMFLNAPSLTDIPGIENFTLNFSQINNVGLYRLITIGRIPTSRYDNLLVNWNNQNPPLAAKTVTFGSSTYTGGGAAEAARNNLISLGWIIQDGGLA